MTPNPITVHVITKIDNINSDACIFAMHLLMPEDWLLDDIKRMGGFNLADDKQLIKLATKYKVPWSIMAVRIGMLLEASRSEANGEI